VFLFLFSVLLSISSGTTLRFSSIKQKSASQQYCYKSIDLLEEALDISFEVKVPVGADPDHFETSITSKGMVEQGFSLAQINDVLQNTFERQFCESRVKYGLIFDYMIAIDIRITSIFRTNSYVIKPVSSGLSYNLYGYIFQNGFLNIFREAATGNKVHVFLATILKQYGTTNVLSSDGSIASFPVSFSDGPFEIVDSSVTALGYIFVELFLLEQTTGRNPSGGPRNPSNPRRNPRNVTTTSVLPFQADNSAPSEDVSTRDNADNPTTVSPP
jgi:hypothetical protein